MSSFVANFGAAPLPYTALVTLLSIGVYFWTIINVVRSRRKNKIPPPLVDGPPDFIRVFRTQMNTLEHLAIHLPLLWLAAVSVGDGFAALAGIIWPVGRVLYAQGYYQDTPKRFPGFITSMCSHVFLFIGATIGILASL